MKAKYLNLKEGDVVRGIRTGCEYVVQLNFGELWIGGVPVSGCSAEYEIVSRAAKLWRDMTPEEKGALLLAHHEGKPIENNACGSWIVAHPCWDDGVAYRVKPEPQVETVEIGWDGTFALVGIYQDDTHRITFNLIDGELDCASIKMEKIK